MDPRQENEDESSKAPGGIDVRHYWAIIRKRRWVIIGTIVLVTAASIVLTLRKPKIYQSTATVVVNPQAPKVMGNQSAEVMELGSGQLWDTTDYYNTQQRIITSRGLARRVVLEYKLWRDPRLVPSPAPGASEDQLIQAAVSAIAGRVQPKLIKESRVMAISVRHTDRQLAQELANDIAQVYIDQNVQVKQDVTRKANRWVSTQLDAAKKSLNTSEDALVGFKLEHGILSLSLEDRQNLISHDLEMFSTALADAKKKRIDLEARRRATAEVLKEDPTLYTAASNSEKLGTLGTLRESYIEQRRKLSGLRERYGPKHPDVIAEDALLTAALSDLRAEGDALLRSLDAEISALKEAEGRYLIEVERLKKEGFDLNNQGNEFKKLAREAENDEANYKMLATRLTESAIQQDDYANNITWLDEARLPSIPISPEVRKDVMVGLALGIILALGLVLFIEFLDRSIKNQEDVEQVVGLPFLGMVPTVAEPVPSKEIPELYIARNPNSTVAECCRVVRTNILFSSPDKPLRTLIVSSSNQGEGKTTTVVNLGITMAQSGHRTLMVDTDMRRPRLHKSLRISNESGVSRLILGETDIDSAVKSTEVPNLYLLPCGPLPPNPAELLQTERFTQLIEQLSKKFDRVIFDSPPILAVTDAAVLSRLVDGMVLVVRASKTSRDAVLRAKRIVATVKSRIVGIVLNDVNLKNPHYSAYYNYYQYQYSEAPAGAGEGDRG